MKEIILAYQGEMSLKGLNRATFESVLLKTMRRRLKSLGNFKLEGAEHDVMREPAGDEDIDAAEERIGKIFSHRGHQPRSRALLRTLLSLRTPRRNTCAARCGRQRRLR